MSGAIAAALRAGESAICLTGASDAELSAIGDAVIAADDDRAFVARLSAPAREPDAILLQLLRNFGIATDAANDADRPEPEALSAAFVQFLRSLAPLHAHAVIVVDDAHLFSTAFYDRLLDIIGAVNHEARPLRLVLIGQPPLLERLREPSVRDLAKPGTWRQLTLPAPAAPESAWTLPRVATAAALLVAVAAGVWWSQEPSRAPSVTGISGSTPTSPPPTPAAPPAESSSPPRPVAEPSASGEPSDAAPASAYRLTIASFRTAGRAQQIADDLRARDLPAATRIDATNTWHQVVAGPFVTRDAARDAQRLYEAAGFLDTRISEVTPAAVR